MVFKMNIDDLYNIYDTLTKAGEAISELSNEYTEAIKGTECGIQEKKLATQIITKFFPSFPKLQDVALEAIFNLCTDDDKIIRLAAMKALPNFCKESNHLNKVAEVMAQMLQLDDPSEQAIANNIFFDILKKDPVAVIKCIFKTAREPSMDPVIKLRCIQFILNKIKMLESSIITTEVQDLMITNVKETLQDCTSEEFVMLMTYLVSTSLVKSFTGQKEILDIVCDQIEIDKDFLPYQNGNNFTDRLVCCVRFVLPLFSTKVESTEFLKYYCNKILPQWEKISEINCGVQYQTELAQQLATISQYCGTLDSATTEVGIIFEVLQRYMPEPPEDATSNDMPDMNFSIVEALLFAFHSLARQCPDFLTSDQQLLKDFRSRLLYFSRAVQGCLKVLHLSDGDKVFNVEEKRIREMCPILLKNINTLIKDLFYQPPIYKCKVQLSFNKKEVAPVETKVKVTENTTGVKRHAPITYETNGNCPNKLKRLGNDKKIYTPPSGKFSHNFHRNRGGFRGGRGRGRGGYRN